MKKDIKTAFAIVTFAISVSVTIDASADKRMFNKSEPYGTEIRRLGVVTVPLEYSADFVAFDAEAIDPQAERQRIAGLYNRTSWPAGSIEDVLKAAVENSLAEEEQNIKLKTAELKSKTASFRAEVFTYDTTFYRRNYPVYVIKNPTVIIDSQEYDVEGYLCNVLQGATVGERLLPHDLGSESSGPKLNSSNGRSALLRHNSSAPRQIDRITTYQGAFINHEWEDCSSEQASTKAHDL